MTLITLYLISLSLRFFPVSRRAILLFYKQWRTELNFHVDDGNHDDPFFFCIWV